MSFNNIIESKLGEKIISANSIGGGCIADSRKLISQSGKKYFLKSYGSEAILQNEANGLKELAKAEALRIPSVIMIDESFLLLEFIATGKRRKDFSEYFGVQFAKMHRFTSDKFGFYENNYIGSNPQKNTPQKNSWVEFYWENRLLFQLKLAEKKGYASSELVGGMQKLEKRLESILSADNEPPCILHGDLWGGNYMVDEKGEPVLIDPAVYYGHREADLGMTALFGGFDSRFYDAYKEAYPLADGWKDRIDLYKLYHVLNHLNLFGSGYYSQALTIIKKYTA